jgi:hypothetical protein
MTSAFEEYRGTRLAPELFAVIPPGALLSPGSTVDPNDCGKVPGSYNFATRTWSGRRDFLKAFATEAMINEWSGYPDSNIGLRAKYFPGIDFDVDLDWLVADLLPIAQSHLGPSPVRGRDGSPRVLLMYTLASGAEPIKKYSIRFTLPETAAKEHVIEILGDGQSYVLEGRHREGGGYRWNNGTGPVDNKQEKLSPITVEQMRAFVVAVKDKLAGVGATIVIGKSSEVGSSSRDGQRRKIGDPALRAYNPNTFASAVRLIPCEEIHARDEWLKLVVAIKAGCGGSEEFYEAVVLPWCLQYKENTREYVRKTWESIEDAGLGADHVYRVAREYDPSFEDDSLEVFETPPKSDAANPGSSLDSPQSDTWKISPVVSTPEAGSPSLTQQDQRRGPVPRLMPADFDPSRLPQRPFVLGHRFLAGAVTLGVAAPGTGKSNFAIITALSIATGQSLTGEPVYRSGPVWIHNNEDSLDELYRRISGVLSYHHIEFESVRNNIFVSSGLDERLIVAMKTNDMVRRSLAVSEMIASIKESGIVHMVVDPFVSTHRGVSENANEEIEQVAEAIRHIAYETRCSIDLIHHSVKSHAGNTESHAGDMNAARGASALIGAVRILYTLSPMNAKTATTLQVPPFMSARLFRLDQGKGNYSARSADIRWFELVTVPIGNGTDTGDGFTVDGDTVAVAVPWTPTQVAAAASTTVDEPETRRQRVRDVVAEAMRSDRCLVKEVVPAVMKEFGIQKSAARNLVMDAVSAEGGSPAQAHGASYVLILERKKPSPPNPVEVVRTAVGGSAEDAKPGGDAPAALDKEAA